MAVPFNTPNLINRKDYGVRVARPYYNAMDCADNQLLFNSGWPILQIVGVYKETLVRTVNPMPSGATVLATTTNDYWHCAVNRQIAYTRMIQTAYLSGGSVVTEAKMYGCTHNLGYKPLAFRSEKLSSLSGYVVLTNIDIDKDIDYPYTDAPLEYFGGELDYGIKTKAYWKPNMPNAGEIRGYGINTRLSSKMVQSVKTKDTVTSSDGEIRWEPPKDETGKVISGVDKFEYYGYGNADGTDILYPMNMVYMPAAGDISQAEYVWVTQPQAPVTLGKTSLVVLRSPMVSPKMVEVTYGG